MADDGQDTEVKQSIQMDEATKAVLRSGGGVPREIDLRGRKFFPKEYKAEGYKGVVWQGKDEHLGDVAIKFTVHADYMERSYLDEAARARSLSRSVHFATFQDAGIVEMPWPTGGRRKFVTFIEHWVEGETLPHFLKAHVTVHGS